MAKYTVSKLYEFEMAHKLDTCYSECCRQAHGHSYKLKVAIQSNRLNKDGMVMDFKQLDNIVNPLVMFFDHSFQDIITFGKNPTAENMAKVIFDSINKYMMGHGHIFKEGFDAHDYIQVEYVELWETSKCAVRVEV